MVDPIGQVLAELIPRGLEPRKVRVGCLSVEPFPLLMVEVLLA